METYLQAKSVFAWFLRAYLLPVVLLLLATLSLVNAQAPVGKGWDKTVDGEYDDQLFAQVATADGDYRLGGFSDCNSSGAKSQNSKGANNSSRVVRLDARGSKVWDTILGVYGDDRLTSIMAGADGESCNV